MTVNPYSRPQAAMHGPVGIVMHWVANPGTSAEFNRRWFQTRADGLNGFGSAHYIIDDRETVRCIPDNEIAYHAGPSLATSEDIRDALAGRYPNQCTIGIELCHPDWTGKFSPVVRDRALDLVCRLCITYAIPHRLILRHYDCTGKDCPRYWVDHGGDWNLFLSEVRHRLTACLPKGVSCAS